MRRVAFPFTSVYLSSYVAMMGGDGVPCTFFIAIDRSALEIRARWVPSQRGLGYVH